MLLPSPVLTICAGNLCRSPFAEAYLRQQFEAAGVEAEVFSRGLLTLPNQRPPKEAQQVASEFNIDLASHVSQPLLGTDLDRAGIVLVMDAGQRQHISKIRPACIGKVFLLSQPSGGEPVADPMGRDENAFRQVYARIAAEVDAWMQRFGIQPATS
ncbi:MAG: phosphotyrosine protein phosphatase [Zetaproteobacteria bacterium]|nr:MAG: phosphotyrosine protein phosphatase [Zetaproteobacteria bacterium]